ncbi:MAG: diguanylate cyclase [Deltaproteobacteria bacterium]|nr:diguanylate cyclase [Deltaproteobacteria bacterium]
MFIISLSTGVLLFAGYIKPNRERNLFAITILAVLAFALTVKIFDKWKSNLIGVKNNRRAKLVDELEFVLLLVMGNAVLIQYTGGHQSYLFPVNYAISAYLAAFFSMSVSMAGLLLQLGIIFASSRFSSGQAADKIIYIHAGMVFMFYVLGFLALRLEKMLLEKKFRRDLQEHTRDLKNKAHDYRLMGTAITGNKKTRDEVEDLLGYASLDTVQENIYFTLHLLGESFALTSIVLLWFEQKSNKMVIKEASTRSDFIKQNEFDIKKGIIGSILKNGSVLSLGEFDSRYKIGTIPYYNGPQEVGSFLGVPVFEQNQMRGVLCADRKNPRPFTMEQVQIFKNASKQIMRTIITQRAFNAIEKTKFEQEKFFEASTMMNKTLGLDEVVQSAFNSVSSIVKFDNAAVMQMENDSRTYRVLGCSGEIFQDLENKKLEVERSLLSMVMENRHYMPSDGRLRKESQKVINSELNFSGMKSVLVLPLISSDKVIGAFVLASSQRALFTYQRREMLLVIANQVAVALQNALMFEKLEQMATTDGLTGLNNHRTFQEKFEEMIQRAKRNNNPVSIIITDIDKFKSVNDTYGHPVGDIVIKKVASILKNQARNIDLVARYGGEEFAVVVESTDSEGAKILGERIRNEVEAQIFDSSQGQFKTSLSLGIATYPQDGSHKQTLIEKADNSLYYAKEHGRNQVVYYGDIA